MRILYYFILTILFPLGLFAQEESVDTMAPKSADGYIGYRVYLSQAEMVKEKKSNFKIKFSLTNTGSLPVDGTSKETYKNHLIIESDAELAKVGKDGYADLIHEKILNSKLNLTPGKSQTLELKIKLPRDRQMGDGGFTVRTGKGGRKDYSRDLCPDLILDSLVLVKKDHKNAYVTFQIKNEGKGAINIIGDVKNKYDNIAIGAFFSGTKKYSSGDLQAGQIFIEGLEETKGILFPGQTMKGSMKVSRKKQSKYTRVLILVVDSAGIVIECNEGNNYQSVLLK